MAGIGGNIWVAAQQPTLHVGAQLGAQPPPQKYLFLPAASFFLESFAGALLLPGNKTIIIYFC